MSGDSSHFAREDYVEEAWRIVDPILKNPTLSSNMRSIHGVQTMTQSLRSTAGTILSHSDTNPLVLPSRRQEFLQFVRVNRPVVTKELDRHPVDDTIVFI